MNAMRLVIPALLAAAFPALAGAQAPAAPRPAGPAITVEGTAEIRSDPDVATVRLGVVAQAPNAQAAQERASRAANAILAAVRGLGVPAAQVQTSDLSLSPLYPNPNPNPNTPRDDNEEPRIVGYQATNTVSVRLTAIGQVGR
jgi:uncharacterized protein YggE